MLLPTGMPIAFRWGDEPISVLDIQFNPSFFDRFVPEIATRELTHRHTMADMQIERIALSLRDDLAAGCPGGRLFGEGMATALVAHLLSRYAVSPVEIAQRRHALSPGDVKRVTDYLNDNLASDTSLEALAGTIHLSPSHFCTVFKQSTGVSPHQYVIQQRVERARSILIRCPELTVAQVAAQVGFADQSHLSRHMKRLLGVSPGKITGSRMSHLRITPENHSEL